jgi:hypothetical protein
VKIALYIEDGLEQIVLTPESETETAILGKLHDGSRELSIKKGSFYHTRGGWQRYQSHYVAGGMFGETESGDESTMIVLRPTGCAQGPGGD